MERGVALKEGAGPVADGAGPVVDTADGTPNEGGAKLTAEQLAAIEDEEALDKMLDDTSDFEERKLIRTALRELRKKKRAQREQERVARQKQREEQRAVPAGGAVGVAQRAESLTASSAHKGAGPTQLSSANNKKVGSIFERQDASAQRGPGGGSSGLRELERKQAERRKELMKPKSSSTPSPKALVQKLEREAGGTGGVCRVPQSAGSGVPNTKNVKQMLLDWCRAKTQAYEGVDIQNFSSSWSDGLAFCALVHHFFPHAFDYFTLGLTDRRHKFELAFSTAERLAGCPALLDVEDMVRMREPDWKCVYTYIQEFYRNLVEKGLVKTKKSC